MKKLFILVLLLLSATGLSALDLYTFGGMSWDYTKTGAGYSEYNEYFSADIAAGIEHRFLYAEAEIQTEMYLSNASTGAPISFTPLHTSYFVRAGVWFRMFYLEYQHVCYHNIDRVNYLLNGGSNSITLGFDSRNWNK